MNRLTRFLMGVGVNFIVIIPVILLPQLIRQGTLTLAEGFLITEAIISVLIYLLVRNIPNRGMKNLKLKAGAIVFTIVSVLVLSLLYLTSVNTPRNWFIILIPVDTVIMAIPVYLFYANGRTPNVTDSVLSEEYTMLLHEMFPESQKRGHEVYIMNRKNLRSFATTTNGRNWKIKLTSDAESQLSEGEIKMLLSETYINRMKGTVLILVTFGAALASAYFDLLIAMPILEDIYPAYSNAFLGVALASFVLLLSLPFYIYALFMRSVVNTDRNTVRRFGAPDDLKNLIRKIDDLRIPPSKFSERQLIKYNRRRQKNMRRRMEAIERVAGRNAGYP